MTKKRNGEIEVLRLFFTIAVLIFHSQFVSNGDTYPMFHGGWLGVEFFFLVSGYLMAAYEDRLPALTDHRKIGSDTVCYVLRKAEILYPYMAFAIVANLLGWRAFTNGMAFPPFAAGELKGFASSLLNFIFPYSLGYKDYSYLGYSWYLSAMIWGIMLIFPLLRRNRNLFYCVLAPVFVALGLGYYSGHYDILGFVYANGDLLSGGLIRGIAEMSMGCLCYKISKKFAGGGVLSKNGRIAITIFEIICFLIVSYRVVFFQEDGVLDYIIFFLMAIVVTIAFSGQSMLAFQISGRLASLSRKFNLALYLNSNCWSYITARAWPEMCYWKATAVYLCMTLVSALVCMGVCDGLQMLWKAKVKEKMCKFLLTNAPRGGQ